MRLDVFSETLYGLLYKSMVKLRECVRMHKIIYVVLKFNFLVCIFIYKL